MEKINLLVVWISACDDGRELVIAEDGSGDCFWCKTDPDIYMPGDAIPPEDVRPISSLSVKEWENVLCEMQSANLSGEEG